MLANAKKNMRHYIYLLSNISKIGKNPLAVIEKHINHDKPLLQSLNIYQAVMDLSKNSLLRQSWAATYCEIATFMLNCGQPQLARKYYQLSLDKENLPSTYSLYLQCLLMDPACSDAEMYKISSRYEQFFKKVKRYTSFSNHTDPNKILNIAYICHFFHNSVSQSLLTPFLREHDKKNVKIFCYSDAPSSEVPNNVKSCADIWVDTQEMNDEDLAQRLRTDGIDILLELNGHCVVNRYGAVARKPVPVQVSYYNQAGTTGLSDLDYIFIGEGVEHSKFIPHYSETPFPLNGISGIAIFPDSFPEPASHPPAIRNGYITFGSFGAAHKVNTQVIKLWAKVLKAVPNSRFFMKAGVLTHEPFLNAYKALFAREGIDLSRIRFEGHSEHIDMLKRYEDVDIALDTFPHAGGTTTMEAIWQGVPVITLNGSKYCSQNGKVVNNCIGHPELIAYTEEEFVTKACTLAADHDRLTRYRKTLRQDFKQSPLTDAKAHAKRLEIAYRKMWHLYCEKNSDLYNIKA